MSDELAPMYRMPTVFGPAPGPRNLPAAHRHRRYEKTVTSLEMSAAVAADQISRLLPPELQLDGEARLEVCLILLADIGWLAGRGYNIVMVRIPARHRSDPTLAGVFVPVVWESMAEPIVTGREELGWPKLFADISYAEGPDGGFRAEASWEGFRFLELTGEAVSSATVPPSPPAPIMLFEKYSPRTGEWGSADARYLTALEPESPAATVTATACATARFAFYPARWENMPTQYPIVNALAALELGEFGPARLTRSSGGSDASGQRRVD